MQSLLIMSIWFMLSGCAKDIIDTTGNISGIIMDSRHNEPIKGASVTINPLGKTYVTGSDGQYEFRNIESQNYTVSVSKPDYKTDNKTIFVAAGQDAHLDFSLTPSLSELTILQNRLDFGNNATTLSFDIKNIGFAPLEWQINEDCSWFSCQPTSGSLFPDEKSSVVVTVSREGLERGNYSQTLAISSNGGGGIVDISMAVQGIALSVNPPELDFGSVSSSMNLTITNNGSTPVPYVMETANNWILLGKSKGTVTTSENVAISVNRNGFSEGDYESYIKLSYGNEETMIPVKMNVPSKTRPIVSLLDINNITYSEITVKGSIISVGSSAVKKYGFCWDKSSNPSIEKSASCNLGDSQAPKDYTYIISSLSSNTDYYIRAYAINNEGVSYSNEMIVKTSGLPEKPYVQTGNISNLQSRRVQISGNILSLGNVDNLIQFGHVWSTSKNPTVSNHYTELGMTTSTGSYNSTITELLPNTQYFVKAYATNNIGTSYGKEITFTTLKETPEIKTLESTEVTHKSARCQGKVISNGGHKINEGGICYSNNPNPTIQDLVASASDFNDQFSCILKNLVPQTVYYARAFVKDENDNIIYGNTINFTTLNREVTIDKNGFNNDQNWN